MMRNLYLLIISITIFLLIPACKKNSSSVEIIETLPPVLTGIHQPIDDDIGGYYVALPHRYDSTNKRYPVIFFLHGAGQVGQGNATDLPNVLTEGIPKLLNEQKFPPNFAVGGQNFSFIILAPQFRVLGLNYAVSDLVAFAKNNYRIDTTRMYIVGFSLGGRLTANYAGDSPYVPAAIVPISGALTFDITAKCKRIADARLPVWSFHNVQDEDISVTESMMFVDTINSFKPAIPARITLFPTSNAYLFHDAWTKATDPGYTEKGINIYQWMLQYKR